MISSLRGIVDKTWGNQVVVELGGVGYGLWVGSRLGRKLIEGEEVKLYTHMAVSENDQALYGFETWDDLQLFKLLITVSGVGPKTGAQILSETQGESVIKAIADAEVDFFARIKGIGKKTAQRIIVDLKSKVGGLGELNLKDELPLLDDELSLSLRQLGFGSREIEGVLRKLPKEMTDLEARLAWCLQNIS